MRHIEKAEGWRSALAQIAVYEALVSCSEGIIDEFHRCANDVVGNVSRIGHINQVEVEPVFAPRPEIFGMVLRSALRRITKESPMVGFLACVDNIPARLIFGSLLEVVFGADKKVRMDLNRITPPRGLRRS